MKVETAAVLTVLFLCIPANSTPECFRSANAAHEAYGGWVSWSHRVKGHRDEKCWFPVDKHRRIYAKSDINVVKKVEHKPPSSTVEQGVLSPKVSGSSPEAAAIRTKLEDWQGIMPANEYVSRMWP